VHRVQIAASPFISQTTCRGKIVEVTETEVNAGCRSLRLIPDQRVERLSETVIDSGFLTRAWTHVYGLWGRYWILPLLPAVYAIVLLGIGDLRWEHVVICLMVAAFAFATRTTRAFFILTLPFLLMAWGDDAIRYLIPVFVTSDRVLGCSMRSADLALFPAGPNQTWPDYFVLHHAPAFDLLAAIPYGIFWMIPLGYACWLFYNDRPRLSFYLWSLLLAQAVVWGMWLAFPAAPPWYIQAHGCSIDASAPPSAAALVRVDRLLGIDYFQSFYSRGMTTFGALPSMHCAFPMVGLLTAWRAASWRTRPLHLLYAGSMIIASVYLDHHWLVDGLLGWLISAAAVLAVGAFLGVRERRGVGGQLAERHAKADQPLPR
jgi:inositol phosphorylceramide synthase catalytic subunit